MTGPLVAGGGGCIGACIIKKRKAGALMWQGVSDLVALSWHIGANLLDLYLCDTQITCWSQEVIRDTMTPFI